MSHMRLGDADIVINLHSCVTRSKVDINFITIELTDGRKQRGVNNW